MEFNGVSFNDEWVKKSSREKVEAYCVDNHWLNFDEDKRKEWANLLYDILVPPLPKEDPKTELLEEPKQEEGGQ